MLVFEPVDPMYEDAHLHRLRSWHRVKKPCIDLVRNVECTGGWWWWRPLALHIVCKANVYGQSLRRLFSRQPRHHMGVKQLHRGTIRDLNILSQPTLLGCRFKDDCLAFEHFDAHALADVNHSPTGNTGRNNYKVINSLSTMMLVTICTRMQSPTKLGR